MTEDVLPPPPQATEPPAIEAITWTGIGPWVNINALVIDPVTPSILYAGTDGGMFKSTNRGANWSAINSGLGDLYIEDVAIDPITPTTIYAAVGYFTPAGGGVFKSVDGGISWRAARNGLPQNVAKLAIDRLTPTTLYAVTFEAGVFKSINGGRSWSSANTGLDDNNPPLVLAVDPVTPSTLYLGTYRGGVFKSTDGGGHWITASSGIDLNTSSENSVDELVIDPATTTTVYAVTRYGGIYKTNNGGLGWTAFKPWGETNWTRYSNLTLDPTTPGTIYMETYELFKSIDGGQNWETCSTSGLNKNFISALVMDPDDTSILYIGTYGGGIYSNQTYKDFVAVQMPSLTPAPTAAEVPAIAVPAATEAPVVTAPVATEAPVVAFPTPTFGVRSTLAPLDFPVTISGPLNYHNDVSLPANARVLAVWGVSAESPDYSYIFGEGRINFANNTFELRFNEPPPSEALNWLGSSALGVGVVIITTDQTLQPGKVTSESLSNEEILGASGQYDIIYVNNGYEIGEYLPWYNEFMPGYNVGKGVDDPNSVFDSFEPVDPGTLEIIIDDLRNIQFVNWT
jgi:photosystem II stability/assembly factor-like uncharacterized protein